MMQGTTSQDTFESTRELERTIAEGLWAARPSDIEWDAMEYVRMETGGTGGSIAKFYLNGQECGRAHTAAAVLFAAKKLRKTMYQLGKGAWLSMSLTANPAGDGWESTYNYTDKPVWELGEPGPNAPMPKSCTSSPGTKTTSPTGSKKK